MPVSRASKAFPIVLGIVVFLTAGTIARAQSTWQGGGTDTTWSTSGNWSTTLANGFNTGLVFQGSSGLANTNDLTTGTATSITFNAGAGAFTIGGNALALTGNIANNSSNLQSIANNIALLANATVTGTNVTLSGTLTNSGGSLRLTNGLGAGELLTLGAINLSEGNTGRTFQLSGTGNTTINGAIANGGSVAGNFSAGGTGNVYSGTVTFAGNSTYSGTTNLGSTTLAVVIGSNSAFGTSRVNVVNNNNTNALSASQDVVLSNTVALNTTLAIAGSNSIELAGATYFGNTTLSTQVTNSISSAGGKLLTISGPLYLQASGSSGNAALATLSGAGNTLISGVIRNSDTGSGTASFTISNTGTTSLSGNNSYSGGTTLSGANATFDLGHNKAFGEGAVTVTNAIRLQASTELSDIRNAFTLSNNLTVRGANNIGLTGTLTNSGGNRMVVNSLDAGRQLTLGAINLSENNTGRTLTFTGTGNTSINGAIADGGTGAGSLWFGSGGTGYSGTVTLSASNSYTGGTTVTYSTTSLTLVLGDKSALGTGALNYAASAGSLTIRASADLGGSNALSNAVTVASGSALVVNGSNSIGFGALTNSGNNRTIANNLDTGKTLSFSGTTFLQESGTGVGRTLIVTGTGNTSFSGPIVNGGTGGNSQLQIQNTGTTTLSGVNTYSGTTTLGSSGGTTTVVVGNDSALGTGAVSNNGGYSVIMASSDVTLSNAFNIVALNAANNSLTFGGGSSITVTGSFYSTNNSLSRNVVNSIGSGKTLTLSGGINLTDNSINPRAFAFGGAGNTVVSGSLFQGGSGAGSVLLIGTGMTTFSGINTYTGSTSISGGGVLVLGSANALPGGIGAAGGLSRLVVSNGVVGLGAGDFTRGLGTTASQVNLSGTSGFAAFGGNRLVNIGGASGTMTWGGTNFTMDRMLLSAAGADGTLDFQNPLALNGAVRTVEVANGSASIDAKLSGVLSGVLSAGLTKIGAGTLQLTAVNTYSGTTTISGGRLLVDGAGNLSNSAAVVINGADAELKWNSSTALARPITFTQGTLSGTGTIGVAVALDGLGETLSPGNSPGIMPFGTSQTWNSFTYEWETNNFLGTTAGVDFDQIAITGGLDLTGGANAYLLDITSLTAGNLAGNVGNFSDGNRSWTILTTTDGITGFDAANWTISTANFTSSPAATGSWSLGTVGNDIVLNYVIAVPEPSTAVFAGIGIAIAGWSLRKRQRVA